jgi:hypothetical protein
MNIDWIVRTKRGRQLRSAAELAARMQFLRSRLNSKTDPQIRSLTEVVERRLTNVTPPVPTGSPTEPVEPKAIAAAREPVNDRPLFQEPARSVAQPIEYHRLSMTTTWPSD